MYTSFFSSTCFTCEHRRVQQRTHEARWRCGAGGVLSVRVAVQGYTYDYVLHNIGVELGHTVPLADHLICGRSGTACEGPAVPPQARPRAQHRCSCGRWGMRGEERTASRYFMPWVLSATAADPELGLLRSLRIFSVWYEKWNAARTQARVPGRVSQSCPAMHAAPRHGTVAALDSRSRSPQSTGSHPRCS